MQVNKQNILYFPRSQQRADAQQTRDVDSNIATRSGRCRTPCASITPALVKPLMLTGGGGGPSSTLTQYIQPLWRQCLLFPSVIRAIYIYFSCW